MKSIIDHLDFMRQVGLAEVRIIEIMGNMLDHLVIGEKRLEAAWHGPAPNDAPTLVFLHEGLGCVNLWRDFPEKLADSTGCGALVYSRLGYGQSDPCELPRPIRFMHDEALDILPKVIEAAAIRDCILIGHSDGGSIALIYAGGTEAVPLRGMITEAAHVFCEDISVKSIQQAKVAYDEGDLRPKLEKYHKENVDCAFRGWNDVWLHPDFVHWNLEEFLPNIRVPMLVIQGEQDEYGTQAQVEAIVRQTGDHTEALMIPDCGHSPHKAQEAVTLEAMTAFIKKILS